MSITTADQMVAALCSAQRLVLQKASITTVASYYYSLWSAAGNPAAGSGAPLYASSNARRAVLDPSGVNAVQSNKDILIKHWMVQPTVVPSGPRSLFNERWKYLGPR